MKAKSEKYSLRVSKSGRKLYKIRLIKNISRVEETVFEFLSCKVPKTKDVIEIYHANANR